MKYAIYVDDNCNEGFYEIDRYNNLSIALENLKNFRKDKRFEEYWLVIIIDEEGGYIYE